MCRVTLIGRLMKRMRLALCSTSVLGAQQGQLEIVPKEKPFPALLDGAAAGTIPRLMAKRVSFL
jgi:hypothetical protein